MKYNEVLPANVDFSRLSLVNRPHMAHPENVEGGFYVMNDACITCGAPEAEAPDLIEHSKKDAFGHCFFKKQPETEEEIERAIGAVAVSCIGALRYGGKDGQIIKKMYEMGLADKCDYGPDANDN